LCIEGPIGLVLAGTEMEAGPPQVLTDEQQIDRYPVAPLEIAQLPQN